MPQTQEKTQKGGYGWKLGRIFEGCVRGILYVRGLLIAWFCLLAYTPFLAPTPSTQVKWSGGDAANHPLTQPIT